MHVCMCVYLHTYSFDKNFTHYGYNIKSLWNLCLAPIHCSREVIQIFACSLSFSLSLSHTHTHPYRNV